jgi:hypothetical protein
MSIVKPAGIESVAGCGPDAGAGGWMDILFIGEYW